MSSTEGNAIDAIDWEAWRPSRIAAQRPHVLWSVAVLAIVVLAHGLAALIMIRAEPAPLQAEAFEEALLATASQRRRMAHAAACDRQDSVETARRFRAAMGPTAHGGNRGSATAEPEAKVGQAGRVVWFPALRPLPTDRKPPCKPAVANACAGPAGRSTSARTALPALSEDGYATASNISSPTAFRRTGTSRRLEPRHGPAMHWPSPRRKVAPCAAQTKRLLSIRNFPGA